MPATDGVVDQWNAVVEAGRCPICAFGLSHTGSSCSDARRGHTYDLGYRDATTGLRISDQDAGVRPLATIDRPADNNGGPDA